MATLGEVLVSDLMEMSVDELRERGMIKLKDPENMTAEHMERLKLLVNGLDESRGLDLGAVNEKLWNLTETTPITPRSRFSSSLTPDPDDPVEAEELRQEKLRGENEAYCDLIQDGWRPSHRPSESNFDFLYEPANHTDIIGYWITVSATRECILQTQRTHWTRFREHQDWRRWRYWKPEWFERFVEEVREYRRKKGLEGDIPLLQDRKEQSRLQDWVEFQYWEYKKADRLIKERERYAEEVKNEETELQAAIDANLPVNKIKWMRDHTLAITKARRGGAEIELQRQNVLLKWIDEQLLIIASECQTSVIGTHVSNDCESPSVSTSLGKRKRSTDQAGHVKDSRRRVEFAEPCDTELPPVKHADVRSSKPANLPESEAPRTPNTGRRRHRNAHLEARANGDIIHSLDISGPVHRKSSPKRTNSSRRDRTRVIPVQTQRERRSVRAGSNTSGLRQQPAATPAEEEVTFQKPKAQPATSATSSKRRSSTAPAPQSTILRRVRSSRVSRARERARTRVSPEATHRDDTRRSPRKSKQEEKPATPRDGKNLVKSRKKQQHLADAFVRRSPRLEGKPAICYPR